MNSRREFIKRAGLGFVSLQLNTTGIIEVGSKLLSKNTLPHLDLINNWLYYGEKETYSYIRNLVEVSHFKKLKNWSLEECETIQYYFSRDPKSKINCLESELKLSSLNLSEREIKAHLKKIYKSNHKNNTTISISEKYFNFLSKKIRRISNLSKEKINHNFNILIEVDKNISSRLMSSCQTININPNKEDIELKELIDVKYKPMSAMSKTLRGPVPYGYQTTPYNKTNSCENYTISN